jgi:hypothetical protein
MLTFAYSVFNARKCIVIFYGKSARLGGKIWMLI